MAAREPGVAQAVWATLRAPVRPAFRAELFFGWILMALFLVQVFTGILLSLYYQPSPVTVAQSVQFIMRDVSWGWLVRGLHHWASHALIVLCLLHVLRMFLVRGYRGAGSANWYAGCLVLALVVVLAGIGELLPWDNDAYWSLEGVLGRLERLGGIGQALSDVIRGGAQISGPTLSRLWSAHSLFLPWLVWMLLIVNLWFLARRMAPRTRSAG
jgi:quinol-cytochrome oxidoreductase complex cytochrome b subunit